MNKDQYDTKICCDDCRECVEVQGIWECTNVKMTPRSRPMFLNPQSRFTQHECDKFTRG